LWVTQRNYLLATNPIDKGQDKARQGKTRQDKARQGKTRHLESFALSKRKLE
jgi:hypothetical protein